MKLIGYARISPQEGAEEKISPEAQAAKIRMYCELYGHELVEMTEDVGHSGKDLKRPAIQYCLDKLKKGEADGIVVINISRLTRSVRDWTWFVEKVVRGKTPCELCSIEENFDTSTAVGRGVMNVLMSIYQMERELTGERTRTVLQYKKSKGERMGRVPYGKDVSEDGVSLVDNQDEQAIIKQMFYMRDIMKMSYQEIAAYLNEHGYKTKEAGKTRKDGRVVAGRWDHKGVLRTLKYHGFIGSAA